MKRIKGTDGVALVECVNPITNKWRVRWDVQANAGTDEKGEPEKGVNYMEEEFACKPTFPMIKELITGWFNQSIDGKILSGFVWNGFPVWLSTENQFNYKAAYDLAVQTNGTTLPVTFKFGLDETPEYHEFKTLDELTDFYTKSVAFIQDTLKEGWMKKDSFDFTAYQK